MILSIAEQACWPSEIQFSDQKIVGNSLQPIGGIITENLFIKAPR